MAVRHLPSPEPLPDSASAIWSSVACPNCGRLLFKIDGVAMPGIDGPGMTWAGGPIVQAKCHSCRSIIEVGRDRPPRVVAAGRPWPPPETK